MFGALGAAGRAGGAPPHRPRPGRRREHLRVGAGGDRVARRGVVRAGHRARADRPDAARASPPATSTRPATARCSSPPTRTRCSAGSCDVMGMPELADDPRFVDHRARGRNMHEIDTIIAGWTERFARRSCWTSCTRPGCPRAWSTSPRTCSTTRTSARAARCETVKDARHGELTMQAVVPRLSETPGDHPLGGPGARRRHRCRAHRAARAHGRQPWRPCATTA